MGAFAPSRLQAQYETQLTAAAAPGGGDSHHGQRTFRAMLRAARAFPAQRFSAARAWLWSDLHLGHENIIRYTSRPFASVEAMDAALYAAWEGTVGAGDPLVFVGDMAMRSAVGEHTWDRVRAAPGAPKHLVFGNHDLTGSGELRAHGFDSVSAALCIDGDPPLLCTHMPLAAVPEGCVNVHGHTHAEPPGRTRHVNVSVEQLGYRPVALARVRALAQALLAGHFPAGATTLARMAALDGHGAATLPLGVVQ